MNDNTSGSGGRLRRAGALAGITLLLAACGGGRSSTAAGLTNYQKALAFSECMRSHGLPDYPDPNSQGGILISNGSETGTPQQFASASKACDHLLPNGGQETPAQIREDVSADLKIAACMRSHGITNFPDPTVDSLGGVHLSLHGIDKNSPQFQSAWTTCTHLPPPGSGASSGGGS
jgi:hypothetical protein